MGHHVFHPNPLLSSDMGFDAKCSPLKQETPCRPTLNNNHKRKTPPALVAARPRQTSVHTRAFSRKGASSESSLVRGARCHCSPLPLYDGKEASARASDKNFHLILHTVYKNPSDATLQQLQLLDTLTARRLNDLNLDSLITVMYAFARAGHAPSSSTLQRFLLATGSELLSLTPRQLWHATVSLSTFTSSIDAASRTFWTENLVQAVETNLEYFRAYELLDTLAAAVKLGTSTFMEATSNWVVATCQDSISSLSNKQTVQLMTVAAAMQPFHSIEVSENMLQDVQGKFDSMTAEEQIVSFLGVVGLGVKPGPEWLGDFLAHCSSGLHHLNAELLSRLIFSLAQVGAKPPDSWLDTFTEAVRLQLQHASVQDVAVILLSLVAFGMHLQNKAVMQRLHSQWSDLSQDQQAKLSCVGYGISATEVP